MNPIQINYLRERPLVAFLLLHSAVLISTVGSRLFVTSYIFDNGSGLASVGLFYIASYVATTVTSLLIGSYAKRFGPKPLLRWAVLGNLTFFLVLFLLAEKALALVIPLGILIGISFGLYWMAFNLISFELNSSKTHAKFFSRLHILNKIISVLIPFAIGYAIWLSGSYLPFFLLLVSVFFVALLLEEQIVLSEPEPNRVYDTNAVLSEIRDNTEIRRLFQAFFLIGLSLTGALFVLVPLVVYEASGSALVLGSVAAFLPLVEIPASWTTARLREEEYDRSLLAASIALMILTAITLTSLNLYTAITFAVLFSACIPFLTVLWVVYSFRALEESTILCERREEYFAIREAIMCVGRVVSFLPLLLISPGVSWEETALKALLLVSVALLVPTAWCLTKVNAHKPSSAAELKGAV